MSNKFEERRAEMTADGQETYTTDMVVSVVGTQTSSPLPDVPTLVPRCTHHYQESQRGGPDIEPTNISHLHDLT